MAASLILSLYSFGSRAQSAEKQAPPREEVAIAQAAINHAQTWYWLARSTENSYLYFEESKRSYQKAIRLLTNHDGVQSNRLRATAQAGLAQSKWRQDNAWDAFRNVYPGVWWIKEADPTLVVDDEGHVMTALGNAWSALAPSLLWSKVAQLYIYPQCKGHDDCEGMRDELLGIVNGADKLYGLPDDELAAALGDAWRPISQGGSLSPEDFDRLRSTTGIEHLVTVNINVGDEIDGPMPIARVDLSATVWSLAKKEPVRRASECGLAISAVNRRPLAAYWFLGLSAVSLVIAWAFQRSRTKEAGGLGLQAAVSSAAIAVGYAIGYFAGEVSGQFLPDWGHLALNPSGSFTRLDSLMWPITHSAVVMVGPLVLSAYVLQRFRPMLPESVRDRISVSVILPGVQAGGLIELFAPLVLAWPDRGVESSIALSAGAMAISVSIAPPLERVLGTRLDDAGGGAPIGAIVTGVVGLVALLPLGMLDPHDGLLGNAPMHWITAAFAVACAVVVRLLSREEQASESSATDSSVGEEDSATERTDGSLVLPAWIERDGVIMDELVSSFATPGLHVQLLVGEAGLGKSRLCAELESKLRTGLPELIVGHGDGARPLEEDADNQGSSEPFGMITQAMGPLLGIGTLSEQQERIEKAQAAVGAVTAHLGEFPGVGCLFGLGEDEDAPAASKQQLIHDLLAALKRLARDRPVLIVLDDFQWADPSTADVVAALIGAAHTWQPPLTHPLTLLIATRSLDNQVCTTVIAAMDQADIEHAPLQLTAMASNEQEAFLRAVGLRTAEGTLCESVHSFLGTGNPLHWQEFLRGLVRNNLASVDDDGSLTITNQDPDTWRQAVPRDLLAQVDARITALQKEDILLLECAAQIGRQFSVSALSSGLGMQRLHVVAKLRELEDETGLIQDLDEHDDLFHLANEVLRDALRRRTRRRGHSGYRELAKEMHHLIIEGLTQITPPPNLALFNHCHAAGPRRQHDAARYGAAAVTEAAKKFAWSEASRTATRVLPFMHTAPANVQDVFNLDRARILRGLGGQENRETAVTLCEALVASPHVDHCDVVFTLLETLYEEKQRDDLEALLRLVDSWQDRGLLQSPTASVVASFYRLLANSDLAETRDRESFRATLAHLIGELEAMRPDEPAVEVQRKRLLSYTLQAMATDLAYDPNWSDHASEVDDLFERSDAIKQELKDLPGLAINLGTRANFHLFSTKHFDKALQLLEDDLALVEKMGDVGAQSSIYNRIAMCHWHTRPTNESNEAAKRELAEHAISAARKAYALAKSCEREHDLLFATATVISYSLAMNAVDTTGELGEPLLDPTLWDKVTNQAARRQCHDACVQLSAVAEWPWLDAVIKLSAAPT